MRLFFCTIALCLTIITLSAQVGTEAAQRAKEITNEQLKGKTPQFDTIAMLPPVHEHFQEIMKQLQEIKRAQQELERQLMLIARSHGIKPEDQMMFTLDNKILKLKK